MNKDAIENKRMTDYIDDLKQYGGKKKKKTKSMGKFWDLSHYIQEGGLNPLNK